MQQYCQFTGQEENVWKTFGPKIRSVLEAFKNGTDYNIHMLSNGLIYRRSTWACSYLDGRGGRWQTSYTRIGMPVEINALWYNAICFALQLPTNATIKNLSSNG
ncbi:MAG: hypothetical protein IPJ66_08995 [Bacteroidetes bacterium]|nr:hypothetical protein [Bacteroidota bacterium]